MIKESDYHEREVDKYNMNWSRNASVFAVGQKMAGLKLPQQLKS